MPKLTASRNKREGKWTPERHFRGMYQRGQMDAIYFGLTREDRKREWRTRNDWDDAWRGLSENPSAPKEAAK